MPRLLRITFPMPPTLSILNRCHKAGMRICRSSVPLKSPRRLEIVANMDLFVENQWHKLLETRISYFEQQQCEAISRVHNEATFRRNFEEICANNHEPDRTTLLAKLQASFRHVASFRRVLEGMHLENGTLNPSNLLWGGCFAVVEVNKSVFQY